MQQKSKKRYSPYLFALTDFFVIIASFAFSIIMMKWEKFIIYGIWKYAVNSAVLFYVLGMLFQVIFRCYKTHWTRASIDDFEKILFACICSSLLTVITCGLAGKFSIKFFITFNESALSVTIATAAVIVSRLPLKYFGRFINNNILKKNPKCKNLLIVGAGVAAKILLRDIIDTKADKYNIIGFIDDDKNKLGYSFMGYKVIGTRDDIIQICEDSLIDEIIVAIPSIKKDELAKIVDICSKTVCKIKVIPDVFSTIKFEEGILKKARTVSIDDLLSRDAIQLDNSEISESLNSKVVLVTGGGGSIGSELCRQIAKFNPEKLIILDIYENNAYDLQNELKTDFPGLNIEVLIASIRDYERLDSVFKEFKPEIVFHAAAHKHVPLMEDSPGEAVKNNVFGTFNVARCANENNVKKFVMISTDKAVNPTNVMGATKRFCEMIICAFQKASQTKYTLVRFGNVLGSNGSVVPLFKKQIENGGPVTVTHRDITRYFMTIPEAAQLVLQSSVYAKGGEIFVLDMGKPVKIYDLAYNLIKLSGYEPDVDIKIEFTGLRPGEKLYEELLTSEDGLKGTYNKSIFVAEVHPFNLDEVKEKMQVLKTALETKDNAEIVKALHEVVPSFVDAKTFNEAHKS